MELSNTLRDKIKTFERENKCKVLYLAEYGSRLYGTNSKNSDKDYKGIFIQSKKKLLLQQGLEHFTFNSSKGKNSSDDIDLQLFSIHKFFQLVKKGETGALDILFSMFSPSVVYANSEFTNLMRDNYKSFLNKNLSSFTGYAVGQASKYGIKGGRLKELSDFNLFFSNYEEYGLGDFKLETFFDSFKHYFNTNKTKYLKTVFSEGPKTGKGENIIEYVEVLGKKFSGDVNCSYFFENLKLQESQFGNRARSALDCADFKALSHACRVLLEVEELLVDKKITFPLKDRIFLASIKQGEREVKEIQNFIEGKLDRVKLLTECTDLPEKSDLELMDSLELDILDLFEST